jgi:UDP-glucose 4-epimerase
LVHPGHALVLNSYSMKKAFVTGTAGFIGSNLVDHLLEVGLEVVGWDNLSTGQEEFLRNALKWREFRFVRGDNLDLPALSRAMTGCDFVFHLAANADVRFGLDHPDRDLQQNTIATFNVLEAMRANSVKKIAFSSTGSVYGETEVIPTPEDAPFPVQTSLYAASKVACEALIQAYCEGYGFEGYIFRFVSILGERYTHGHIFDFYRQLLADPKRLKILGDGYQRKSYLYVHDCIEAILHVIGQDRASKAKHRSEVFNLGAAEYCTVRDSISWICSRLGLKPELEFTGGEKGWVGDNPFIFLETKKIRDTGWQNELSIQASVWKTLDWLRTNSWILEKRR